MKSLIASILILGLVGMMVGVAVKAQEASVSATVTPQIISVSVEDGNVDYGILDVSESSNTFDGTASEQQIITSGSNVPTNVALRSSDAVGTTVNWNLEATAGPDQFIHSYDIDAVGSAVWTVFPVDNSNSATVATLGVGGSATLDLKIDMPINITDTSAHSITVTILATE